MRSRLQATETQSHLLLRDGPGLLETFLEEAARRRARAVLIIPEDEFAENLRRVDALAGTFPRGRGGVALLPAEPMMDDLRIGVMTTIRELLRGTVVTAQEDGWSEVWFLSSAGQAMVRRGDDDAALRGEAALQELIGLHPAVALCPYAPDCPEGLLQSLGHLHTHVIWG